MVPSCCSGSCKDSSLPEIILHTPTILFCSIYLNTTDVSTVLLPPTGLCIRWCCSVYSVFIWYFHEFQLLMLLKLEPRYNFIGSIHQMCYVNNIFSLTYIDRLSKTPSTLSSHTTPVSPCAKSLSGSGLAPRVKKLRETLVAVQQLDKNMSSLRSWLAHIETELSRPIVYDTCDDQEIQRKLSQQQASGTTRKAVRGCKNAKMFIDVLVCLWPMWKNPAHPLFTSVHLGHAQTNANVFRECVCFSVNAKLYHICVTHSELVEKDTDHTRKSQRDSDIRCWLFFYSLPVISVDILPAAKMPL